MTFLHRSLALLGLLILFSFSTFAPVYAETTLLPEATGDTYDVSQMTEAECVEMLRAFEGSEGGAKRYVTSGGEFGDAILACAIKSGKIEFWMVPFFVKNALDFLIGLAGLIAVLMILLGAYFYIAGGLTDDAEKGKTIITYAILGLAVVAFAWLIVNVILLAITA